PCSSPVFPFTVPTVTLFTICCTSISSAAEPSPPSLHYALPIFDLTATSFAFSTVTTITATEPTTITVSFPTINPSVTCSSTLFPFTVTTLIIFTNLCTSITWACEPTPTTTSSMPTPLDLTATSF